MTSFRTAGVRYVYHRCACGREWTDRRPGPDAGQPISGDELLDLHEHLAAFHGPLSDLMGTAPSP